MLAMASEGKEEVGLFVLTIIAMGSARARCGRPHRLNQNPQILSPRRNMREVTVLDR